MSYTQILNLRATPYGEKNIILHSFSDQMGLITLFCQPHHKISSSFTLLTTPLTLADVYIKPGKNDWFYLEEGEEVITSHNFQNSVESFQTACKIGHSLLRTQWPLKPAPQLFGLTKHLLYALIENPNDHLNIEICFYIKLLVHEGYLHTDWECAVCKKKISAASWITLEEEFCKDHSLKNSIEITEQDHLLIKGFALEKQKNILLNFPCDDELYQKVLFLMEKLLPS